MLLGQSMEKGHVMLPALRRQIGRRFGCENLLWTSNHIHTQTNQHPKILMKTAFKPSVFQTRMISLLTALFAVTSSQLAAATTYLWAGAGSPDNTNWSTTANWSPAGSPGAADTAVFGATDTTSSSTTFNNVVSGNTTIAALNYTNTTSGQWHVTDIPANVTLTVSGTTTMGGFTANSLATSVAMTDAGTLVLNGNLTVGDAGASANVTSTMDFSGLSNFVYNASSGTITFGIANYSLVNVKLAAGSNNITAATINDNTLASSSSATTTFSLGSGTNIFNVGTFNIAAGR